MLSIVPVLAATRTDTPSVIDWLLAVVLEDLWGTLLTALANLTGIDMLGFAFMQRAYLAAICVAIIGPLIGSFLVHREMAMIADTLAHSAFAGVAAGLFVNATLGVSAPPLATALIVAALAAVLVQGLIDQAGAYADTSLAMVLTGAFGLGSVLITATDGGIAVGINAYLFGSLATVTSANAGILVAVTLLVGGIVMAAYRPLIYITFDEVGAQAARINVAWYNTLLAVLTAVVVVGAMQIMGVILVAAMLVIPVTTAATLGGFKRSIMGAIVAGQCATVLGVTLSYRYDVAAGGTIVLVAIGIYLLVKLSLRLRHRFGTASSQATDHDDRSQTVTDGGADRH